MITFIVSHAHAFTVAALKGRVLSPVMPESRAITYDDLFAADELEPGTYVFTDMERLHPAELRLAARFFRRLGAMRGFRVLNDPARVRTRYALLRSLAEAGLNDFDAYRADGLPKPRRFPVFLRIASDHAGPLGDLVRDQAELVARLRALETEGIPLVGVLVVEFCADRGAHGFYEKLAFLKIGDRVTLSALLLGDHWNVKRPADAKRTVSPEITRDHLEAIRTDRYAEQMRAAFEIAGIDYGRADVGIRGGRLQVYEINTNPNITATDQYVSEEHRESREIFRARFGAMMHGIDMAAPGYVVRVNLGWLDKPSKVRREIAKAAVAARQLGLPPQPVRRRGRIGRMVDAVGQAGRRWRSVLRVKRR